MQRHLLLRSLLLGAVLATTPASAAVRMEPDAGRIVGRITDAETGDALIGANVIIQGTAIGAATDVEGRYVIPSAPAGRQILQVTYLGYDPVTREVVVPADGELVQDFELSWRTVQGQEIIITAQASGQMAAINQQLTSNTITNIVSADRIQELPDVNAAESIGRLPGVSIQRSGGEANRVSIRGLSPKYNTVTVNGVRLPATGGNDRSVDLSLISSSMLDGIEVMKAITPDKDADAIGGSVDLRLREAPDRLMIDVLAQGGYNKLQSYYGNYKFVASASNRFFGGRLGVIAGFNTDEYDRSADKLSADYRQDSDPQTGETIIILSSLGLREETVTRGRTGASAVIDYRIPNGKITANGFFNRLSGEGVYRINQMSLNDNRHYYDTELRSNRTSIMTSAMGVEQDLGMLRYDVGLARTASRSNSDDDLTWRFGQEGNAFTLAPVDSTTVYDVAATVKADSFFTGLTELYVNDTDRDENVTTAQLNVQVPFRLGDSVSGFVKAGTKFRWLDRMNDLEQEGRGGLYYGSGAGSLSAPLDSISVRLPAWNLDEIIGTVGRLPMYLVQSDYSRTDFLDGDFDLGWVTNVDSLELLTAAMLDARDVSRNMAIGSRGNDYDGIERYQAVYLMAELNLGRRIRLIPGFRMEWDYSRYNGQRYREVVINNIQQDPTDLEDLTNIRKNDFFLPMVHLQLKPTEWLTLRGAYTETLTRPDYIHYAPITSINNYRTYVRAANSLLRPAHSKNWDAALSIYQSRLGLFTVAGFTKSIDDLIMQVRYTLHEDVEPLPGMNVPDEWIVDNPQADTYINNPFPATYRGIELDWQTNFWWAPSVFKGIVLNVNYTRIFSETDYQAYYLVDSDSVKRVRPRLYFKEVKDDSLRTGRMPDQPKHIANLTLGYDYRGFSARLSFLYQTNTSTWINPTNPLFDNYSGDYSRWDLSVSQKLQSGLEIFANFNNLNNRPDRNFRGSATENPTYIEYYGFTMDIGARFRY